MRCKHHSATAGHNSLCLFKEEDTKKKRMEPREGASESKADLGRARNSPLFLGRRHYEWRQKAQNSFLFFYIWEYKKEKRQVVGRRSNGRAPGGAGSARCVRRLDGSLVPAIRITYRVSLRSSSSREPRYPSTGVVSGFLVFAPARCGGHLFPSSVKKKQKGLPQFAPFNFFNIERRSTIRG